MPVQGLADGAGFFVHDTEQVGHGVDLGWKSALDLLF
jgi:hypothetical protein